MCVCVCVCVCVCTLQCHRVLIQFGLKNIFLPILGNGHLLFILFITIGYGTFDERNYWMSMATVYNTSCSVHLLKNGIKGVTLYIPVSFAIKWSICTHGWNMLTDVGRPQKCTWHSVTSSLSSMTFYTHTYYNDREWLTTRLGSCGETHLLFVYYVGH